MNINEKLAVITTFEKLCKERAKEIRAEADEEFGQLYDEYGTEKMGLKLGGQKVGDFILTFNAEHFVVTDKAAFEEWCLDYGLATVRKSIRPGMMGSAIAVLEGAVEPESLRDYLTEEVVVEPEWEEKLVSVGGKVLFQDSGMEVPGVAFIPRTVKGTQVRGCKPDQVIPLIQALPGGVEALLLGGGE